MVHKEVDQLVIRCWIMTLLSSNYSEYYDALKRRNIRTGQIPSETKFQYYKENIPRLLKDMPRTLDEWKAYIRPFIGHKDKFIIKLSKKLISTRIHDIVRLLYDWAMFLTSDDVDVVNESNGIAVVAKKNLKKGTRIFIDSKLQRVSNNFIDETNHIRDSYFQVSDDENVTTYTERTRNISEKTLRSGRKTLTTPVITKRKSRHHYTRTYYLSGPLSLINNSCPDHMNVEPYTGNVLRTTNENTHLGYVNVIKRIKEKEELLYSYNPDHNWNMKCYCGRDI